MARAVLSDVDGSKTMSKGRAMSTNKLGSGSFVATLRQRLEMTQEEFAHAIGVTVSTVNRWENGHNSPTRLARKALYDLASERGGPGPQLNIPAEG